MGNQNPDNRSRQKVLSGKIRIGAAGAWDILRDAVDNYQINGDANQAAAIALYGILSVIPLFILTLVMASHLFSSNPTIQSELMQEIRGLLPYLSGDILAQLGQIERKKQLLGWVGIISLVWLSSTIFNAIETALNRIFRSTRSRNYIDSKMMAIGMIPLGWSVGIASISLTYISAILAKQPLLTYDSFHIMTLIHVALFRYGLPFLLTVLFATIVYRAIPTSTVSLKSALMGSVIFSALLEIAKYFFTWYVANYTRYNVIFGSLEAVVILVIWVFYVALIFLFCAELVASYEKRDMILIEKALLKPGKKNAGITERLFRKFGRIYPKGTYIFKEGDAGREMYYILTGRVQVEKEAGQVTKLLADMGPGEYFGEMAALIDAPRTASAHTVEDSDVAVISGDTFRSLLQDSGEVSLLMLQEFSHRIQHTNTALEGLTRSWIRLMAILYFLKEWPLQAQHDPVAELARYTGKEPEDIRDVLRDLDRHGILSLRNDHVVGFAKERAWELMQRQAME